MSRTPTNSRTTTKPRATPTVVPRTRIASTTNTSSPARTKPALTPQASKSSLKPTAGKAPSSPKKPQVALATGSSRDVSPSKPALSIREAIALKRAEAKKTQVASSRTLDDGLGPDALPDHEQIADEEPDMLGRWSVRETIERARSTGNLNLASRDLPCIPSILFEVHLGVTPEPLALVPNEPAHPPNDRPGRRRGGNNNVSWYEAQDLEVLKAGNNEILEIQPEISLFGSLKHIDLHNNKLSAIPPSFADLMALSILDLSHNRLTALPPNLFALPKLVTLDISHNALTAVPFSAPFASADAQNGFTSYTRASDDGSLFAPVLSRATKPLPALYTLNAAHNHIPASAIEHEYLPSNLAKLDLSANPLGGGHFGGAELLRALSHLPKLSELLLARAELNDDAFPAPPSAAPDTSYFPALRILDAGETQVSAARVAAFLAPTGKEVQFDVMKDTPPPDAVRAIVGKMVMKEAWEIEVERRGRGVRAAKWEPATEDDKYEDERGLPVPAAAARKPEAPVVKTRSAPVSQELVKEAWEIEAENGMNTAGARRRARALAAAAEPAPVTLAPQLPSPEKEANTLASPTPGGGGHLLSHSQYWDPNTGTLTLPSSSPAAKNLHGRSFSLAMPRGAVNTDPHLALPTQTLPLSLIASRPVAANLRVLILAGRRLDPTFDLPTCWQTQSEGFFPKLETLSLENCKLGDSVPISLDGGVERSSVPLLPAIATLFPSLRSLDLSYNAITSAALTEETLATLVLASSVEATSPSSDETTGPPRRSGLRRLSLRGNHLEDVEGFAALGARFRANRTVLGWGLDELDVRDNSITRLPAELGLLPLDVLLVDGNMFRVPARRVWEREGTRGLLSWLRGRVE